MSVYCYSTVIEQSDFTGCKDSVIMRVHCSANMHL